MGRTLRQGHRPELIRAPACNILAFTSVLELKSLGERVVGSDEVLRRSRDPGPPGDLRDDRRRAVHRGLRRDAPGEPGADERLVDQLITYPQLAPGVQLGQPRRGSGAARRAVEQ